MIRKHIAGRFQPGGIGRHISWLLLHSGAEAALMTVAALLAARWFGPVAWGQLGILLAGVQLVGLLGDGFHPTIVKFVADARAAENPAAARMGWRFVWITVGVLLAVASLLGAGVALVFSSQLAAVWVLLAVILAVARGWRSAFDGSYRALQQFRAPAIAGITSTALMAGSIIGFAAAGYKVSAYLGIMVGGTVLNCIWLASVYRKMFLTERSDEPEVNIISTPRFLRYTLPLALRGLSAFLFLKINIWMLGAMAGEYDAGQFRLTDQFLTIPALMLSSILAAVAPRVAKAQLASMDHLALFISKVYGLMLLLTVPLGVFFWFNSPLLNLVFPEYGPASEMLRYFAPSIMVMGLGYAAALLPIQCGKPGVAFAIMLTSGVVNVIAAYLGFKLSGVSGLAIATATVHFASYTGTVLISHRVFRIPFRIRFA